MHDIILAVDVVLLPPAEAMRRIVELASELPDGPIRLDEHTCLPHVSLGMGVLPGRRLFEAKRALAALGGATKPQELSITEARSSELPNGKLFSELIVKLTPELTELFQATTEHFRPLFEQTEVTTDMFASPPVVDPISTTWVRHYYDRKPGKFYPHITLGQGRIDSLAASLQFTVKRLAFCNLGTYCTCRNILAEVALG